MGEMAVSYSVQPLVFDALPALKVRHYCGAARFGDIYTFARFYALQNSLALSLCVFEEAPDGASLAGFAVRGEDAHCALLAAFSHGGVSLSLLKKEGAASPLPAPAPERFAGEDEQGWYWGVNCVLPPDALEQAGVHLAPGGRFWAAVGKYRSDEDAFGCSYPVEGDGKPFSPARFEPCVVVAY